MLHERAGTSSRLLPIQEMVRPNGMTRTARANLGLQGDAMITDALNNLRLCFNVGQLPHRLNNALVGICLGMHHLLSETLLTKLGDPDAGRASMWAQPSGAKGIVGLELQLRTLE